MKISYICDGKKPECCDSPWCKWNGRKDGCDHTIDEKYALHGACDGHPSWFPERFARYFEEADDWWEKK